MFPADVVVFVVAAAGVVGVVAAGHVRDTLRVGCGGDAIQTFVLLVDILF